MRNEELANQLVERFYNTEYEFYNDVRLPEERLVQLVSDTANKQAEMINSWGPFEQILYCLQNGVSSDEIIRLLAGERK